MHFIVNSTTWYIFELYLERSEGVNQTFGFTIHWRKKKKLWQSFSLLAAFINKECVCSKPNCWYVHLYNISEDRQLSSTWALFRQQPDWYQHITDILYQEICYKIRNQKYDWAHFWNQRNYFVYPAESAQRLFTLITTLSAAHVAEYKQWSR